MYTTTLGINSIFMNKYKEQLVFPVRIFTYTKLLIKFVLSPIYKRNDALFYKLGKTSRMENG